MKNFARLVAICLVALIGLARLPAVDAQERSPDGVSLDQLAKAGSDLSKLHHVDFFLHFPTQQAADNAASRLDALAFVTEIGRGKTEGEWVLQASKMMFPVESDLMGLRDKLNAIAANEHGVYDGWQARAVK